MTTKGFRETHLHPPYLPPLVSPPRSWYICSWRPSPPSDWMTMKYIEEASTRIEEAMSPEAIAFMLELGMCPGISCPLSEGGCNPSCPVLRSWTEDETHGL